MEFNRFYFNEEGRQHISLSAHAISVIEANMVRFNEDYNLANKSGFMNKIIINYHDHFPFSKNEALKELNVLKLAIIGEKFSTKLTANIIETFSDEIMKNLIREYSKKYSNEIQFKLKLNKEACAILESLDEAKYFNNYAPRSGVAFYIKMILETYAEQNREARERIYFREVIEEIQQAINNKCYIKYKEKERFVKAIPILIYKPRLKQNLEVRLVYYLSNDTDDFSITTETLKNLKKYGVRALKEKHNLNKEIINSFNKEINQFETSKIASNTEEFIVRFTEGGLQRFIIEEDNLSIIGILTQEDRHIYKFKATETQVFFNLFKFGYQAEIISPIRARERFKLLYKQSYEFYEKEMFN